MIRRVERQNRKPIGGEQSAPKNVCILDGREARAHGKKVGDFVKSAEKNIQTW